MYISLPFISLKMQPIETGRRNFTAFNDCIEKLEKMSNNIYRAYVLPYRYYPGANAIVHSAHLLESLSPAMEEVLLDDELISVSSLVFKIPVRTGLVVEIAINSSCPQMANQKPSFKMNAVTRAGKTIELIAYAQEMPIPTDRANKNAQWIEPFRKLKNIHVEEDRPVQLALTPTPELLSAGKLGTQSLAASMEFAMQGLVKLMRSGALPLESAGLLVSSFLDWQIPSLEVVAKQGGVITFLYQNDNETQTKNYKICPFTVQFNNVASQKIGGGTIAIAIPKTYEREQVRITLDGR